MKKTTVSLGGINRNDYDGSAHIVNLRLKDKAFRPVPEPTKVDKEIDGKVEYIHASSDYRNLIDYKHYASVTEVYYRGNLNDNKKEQSILIGSFQAKVLDVTHIGNTLIFLTDNGQYYFLFKNGEYKSLGNKIPEVKALFKTITPTNAELREKADEVQKKRVEYSTYFASGNGFDFNKVFYDAVGGGADDALDVATRLNADFEGQVNQALKGIYSLGCLPEFPIQMRVAIRLYDGSYIGHSSIPLISRDNGLTSVLYCPSDIDKARRQAFWKIPEVNSWSTISVDGKKYSAPPQMLKLEAYKFPNETEYRWSGVTLDELLPSVSTRLDIDQLKKNGSLLTPVRDALGKLLKKNGYVENDSIPFPQTLTVSKEANLAIRMIQPKVKLEFDEELFTLWEDIIQSIDIFISKPINPYKIGEISDFPIDDKSELITGLSKSDDYMPGGKIYTPHRVRLAFAYYNNYAVHERLAKYDNEDLFDQVKNNGVFYRLKSIDIPKGEHKKDEYKSWFTMKDEIADNMDVIEQNETLPDDYISRDTIIGKFAYSYNNSLHISDITQTFFNGFTPREQCISNKMYIVPGSEDNPTRYTGKGYCLVKMNNIDIPELVSFSAEIDEDGCFISPMLYYPNTNAAYMEIGIYDSKGVLWGGRFFLSVHPALNGSYYLDPNLEPIKLTKQVEMPERTVASSLVYHNKMIATSISNPFVFTAERTNYIGTGSILAMMASTTALSQGQSSQMPLYVFCTDGVYTLSTNAEGEYMTARNVSFDILADRKKLCATENAIVFGTQQGLKVIQGGASALLSAPLNGSAHRYEKGEAYENPYLAQFITEEDTRDFNTFLCDKDTSVYYDYPNNEVWVFNPRSRYAYILSLYNNVWSMRDKGNADRMVGAYPSLYLRDGNALADVTRENDSKLPFAIITNPIGGQEFTRIADITIDTRFITNDMQCTLLAGNNPFRLTKVKTLKVSPDGNPNPVPIPALHLGRIPASVRYAQFAIKGNASDAMLTGFTMLTDTESYNPVR